MSDEEDHIGTGGFDRDGSGGAYGDDDDEMMVDGGTGQRENNEDDDLDVTGEQ